MNYVPGRDLLATFSLSDLDSSRRAELETARRGAQWDAAEVQRIVSRWYGELSAVVNATVVGVDPFTGGAGERIEIVLDTRRHEDDLENLLGLGLALARRGAIEEAQGLFRQCVQLDPRRPDSRRLFGQACLEVGDIDEAERQFITAVELDPEDAESLTMLGNVYYKQRRHGEAIEAHRRSLAISPSAIALSNLGAALATSGDLPGAIQVFQHALRLDPHYAPARHGLTLASEIRDADA